jgi:hypothetical protein
MKKNIRSAAILCLAIAAALSVPVLHAQSPTISIDRINYYTQTGASTVTPQAVPFSLNIQIRGGSIDMSHWGPAFYKPGSGGTPQSGSSSDTNTGTLNFSASPNNGTDFSFMHDFATNADMAAFYPIAPTDGGAYGIKFLGSAPPSPALFTDGMVFASGPTYPSVTPQVTAVNNGAVWSSNRLRIKASGTTTLTLNTFPEYGSTTYGSLIGAGIYSNDGVIGSASVESGYLPMGDSSESPDPIYQAPITQLTVDGSWFVPGKVYTLELQYSVIGGRPEEANLNSVEWQGVSTYRKIVLINLMVPSTNADFNSDGKNDIIFQNTNTGRTITWFMDGTTKTSYADLATVNPEWYCSGSGDFNGDDKSDLIWQNVATGQISLWLMNGTTHLSSADLGYVSPEWHVAGTGDFNGDGKTDIILQNVNTGRTITWFMDGTTKTSYADLGTVSPEWHVAGSGDFNSDGKTDIIFQNVNTGRTITWFMDGTTKTSYADLGTVSPEWHVAGSGDFNSDGKTDIVFQNVNTGRTITWLMDGSTKTSYADLGTVSPEWRAVNRR